MFSIVSIDIGLRTLSLYKEYFNTAQAKLVPFPKNCYDKMGEAKPEMKQYVERIGSYGVTSFIVKKDLGEKRDYFSGKAIQNLFHFMDDLESQSLFDDVQEIIIERQMKKNNIASALMYYIQSWFLIKYGPFKKVILYPSKQKTRILGAPLKVENEQGKTERVNKYFRKKWSTLRAYDILTKRKETDIIDYIFVQHKDKKDDLCDVITQCLSYHILRLKKYHAK